MLHRSFKPAKCKTALKLAVSRIKLLKNKKDAQVKQIKRELAQLLETGQYRTARIRVEHVLREEKTKAAFELIEIYCELIATRLPMIESQKNCPIDMKEAITSVAFASPRCADIPELMDVRKHFTAKYGKEFISNAVELRPDCGVSRMLVEKLSTKSPDGPTKMKILAAIAEEHNVKWDPESFEEKESKPPEDLLNGPNTYGMASKIQVEPPRGPPPPNHDVKEPSNVQIPPRSYENHDASMNFNEQNARSSPRFRDSASSNVSSNQATTSSTRHPEVRSSGNGTDGMENRRSGPGDGNAPSFGRENWNMHFKDAASAAQAAAESAEMAGMAARAAAELSRQHSSELRDRNSQSETSINNGPPVNRHQMADRYPQKKSSEPEKRDSRDEVSTERQSSNTNVYVSGMQTGRESDKISYFSNMRSEEKSSRPSSQSTSVGEGSTKRQSSNTVMYVSEMQTGVKTDNISNFGNIRSEEKSSRASSRSNSSIGSDDQEDVLRGNDHISYLGDVRTGEQSIRSSSHSHSRNFSNDHGNVSNGPGEDALVSDANIYQSTKEMNSYGVFDDSGSDDDKCKSDVEDYKGQESSLHFPSSPRNLFSPSADLDPWSSKRQTDEVPYKSISQLSSSSVQYSPPVFSENLTDPMDSSQPNDLMPVAFDASDGPSSESEEELDKSKLSQSTVSKFSSGQSQSASRRSLGSSSSEEANVGRTVSEKRFDYDELPTGQSSQRLMKSRLDENVKDDLQTSHLRQTMEDSEDSEGCSCASEIDNELKFGILTGGLRNKGLRHPLYTRKSSGSSLSVKQITEDTKIEQTSYSPTVRASIVSGMSSREPYNPQGSTKVIKERSTRTPVSYVASDDDSSEDELSHGTVIRSQDPYNQKLGSEVKTSSRSTTPFFDSDDSEVEEDLQTKISTSNARPSARLSRRTQPSSSNSVRSSSSKATVVSDVLGTSDNGKASPRSSFATETLPKPLSHTRSSERSGSQERSRPVEQAVPKSIPESCGPVETSKSYRNSSSLSTYPTETLRKPLSQTKSSERSGREEWNRPVEQAVPKSMPESQRSSPVETSRSYRNSSSSSSYSTETLPKPLSQKKISERSGSQEWNRPVEQAVLKSIPESQRSSPLETLKSYRNSSSSYATEAVPMPLSQTKSSERPGRQEWHRPIEQAAPKPTPESKRSSYVETSRSFSREQSSNLSPKVETAGGTESSKSSGSTVETRPKEKASHVHPKLPDADDIFAKFSALRQSRQ